MSSIVNIRILRQQELISYMRGFVIVVTKYCSGRLVVP